MTPAAPLVAFCAVMAAIAVGRLVRDEDRDPVDIGTALAVVGITVIAVCWHGRAESWLARGGQIGLAVVGILVVGFGLALIVRNWNDPADTGRRSPDRNDL